MRSRLLGKGCEKPSLAKQASTARLHASMSLNAGSATAVFMQSLAAAIVIGALTAIVAAKSRVTASNSSAATTSLSRPSRSASLASHCFAAKKMCFVGAAGAGVLEFGDVGTGRNGLTAPARNYHAFDVRIRFEAGKRVADIAPHRQGNRVQPRWIIKINPADMFGDDTFRPSRYDFGLGRLVTGLLRPTSIDRFRRT